MTLSTFAISHKMLYAQTLADTLSIHIISFQFKQCFADSAGFNVSEICLVHRGRRVADTDTPQTVRNHAKACWFAFQLSAAVQPVCVGLFVPIYSCTSATLRQCT